MQGANADALEAVARQMQTGAQMLERAAQSITSQLQSSPWEGARAQAFRSEWSRSHRVSLLRTASQVSEAANLLRRNAAQQRQASDQSGTPLGGVVPGHFRGSGPSAGEVAAFGPRVLRRQTQVYELSGSGAELGGSYGTEVVKEYLSDGRVRVIARSTVLGGVKDAGLTASASWGERTEGVGASADASLGLGGGSTMIFADDAAAERQIRLGLAARATALAGPLAVPFAAAEVIHGLVAGDDIRSSSGLVGRATAGALGTVTSFFGGSDDVGYEGSLASVVDWSGAAGIRGTTTITADAAATLWGGHTGVTGAATVEYEAVAGVDGQAELIVRSELFDGDRRTMIESRIDIDRSLVSVLNSGGDLSKVLAEGVRVDSRFSEYVRVGGGDGTYGVDAVIVSAEFDTSSLDERLVSTSRSSVVYRRN